MNQNVKGDVMNNRAQSLLEYAILCAVIIAALFGMQIYMKRAMQGNLYRQAQQAADGGFYSPKATTGYSVATSFSIENQISMNDVSTSHSTLSQAVNKIEQIAPIGEEPRRLQ